MEKELTRNNYKFKEPRDIPAGYSKKQAHFVKCKNKACSTLGVTEDHINKAMLVLNGRKVDGFYVEDLIGRFGFFDGMCVNRHDLASKYDRKVKSIEIATDRLSEILNNADVKKSYKAYVEGNKAESNKKLDNHVSVGGEI